MEKTIKSLNIVAVALLIVNLGVELWDRFRPQKQTKFIWQNTAWGEQEGVRRIIEEKLPSIKVYFLEEEPGCELFTTNPYEHFPEKYFIDSYDEPMYFDNLTDAARYVSEIVGHDVKASEMAIAQAIDIFLEQNEDDDTWYSFHTFIEVDE